MRKNNHFTACFAAILLILPLCAFAQTAKPDRAKKAERSAIFAARKAKAATAEIKRLPAETDKAAADAVTLYGCLVDSYGDYYPWGGGGIGIYSFTTTTADPDFKKVKLGINSKGGGTYKEGIYYAITMDDYNPDNHMILNVYDTENDWAQQGSPIKLTHLASDMTFDPITGNVYGCFTSDNATYTLGTLNTETGEISLIGEPCGNMSTLAATKGGDLYAIMRDSRKMMYVDKTTGTLTEIGDATPVVAGESKGLIFAQSATFDWSSGTMYWSAYYDDSDAGLWAIKLDGSGPTATIAEKTLLKDYGYAGSWTCDEVTGLYIVQSAAAADAPDRATGLTAVFAGTSLAGEITFTMPTADTSGNDLTSTEMDYTLTIGEQTQTGKAMGGAMVTAQATVPADGMYTISVTATNGTAASLPATLTLYIGKDTPAAAVSPTLTASGQVATVTWTAPEKGAHGGTTGVLTYNVTRQPEGIQVAQGISETTFTETIADEVRKVYFYEITTLSDGVAGPAAQTNKLTIGSTLSVPYFEAFDEATGFDGYTVIDVNRDGATWKYNPANNPYTTHRQNIHYGYSELNAADDWVITPGIKLTSDNMYKFCVTIQSNLEQTFRVMAGNAPDAAAMTTEIIPQTNIAGNYYSATTYTGTIRPAADGKFYFGIHATSIANSSDMFLDDIKIEMLPVTRPGKAENMKVTPGAKGALNATVTFNVPAKRLNGEPLESVSEVLLYRDKELLATMTGKAPGQECSYEDNTVSNGLHTYTVTAFNEDGRGEDCETTAFVGVDVPGPISNLKIVEDWQNEPGTVVVSWDAPSEVGQNGGYVDTSTLKYYDLTAGADDRYLGTETSFRDKIDISKGQTAVAYCIYAENSVGTGFNVRRVASGMVGPAKQLPLNESFMGLSTASGPWVSTVTNGDTFDAWWDICDGSVLESGTQDMDGGVAFFETAKPGLSCMFRSPKIDISTADTPAIVFYLWYTGSKDSLSVKVSKEYGPYEKLHTYAMDGEEKGWHRCEIPLDAYKGSAFVQIGFEGISLEGTRRILSMDNISVRNLVDNDLQAWNLNGPKSIKVGEKGVFTFTLTNRGANAVAAADYTVELYKNDALAATAPGKDIAADRSVNMSISDIPTIDDAENSTYFVKANYTADRIEDNNQTERKAVTIDMPSFPAVTDLAAACGDSGIELTWSEPNVADMPAVPVTEDFESYKDFIISGIGKWQTIDGDGAKTILLSLDGVNPLQYENAGMPMAYQVFNPEAAGIPLKSWKPYSGNKMLAAFSTSATTEQPTPPANDDWLISPELNGKAQTVKFFAKASNALLTESFRVYYSTTDANRESFIPDPEQGETTVYSSTEWQECRINLPAGAKYFAIQCTSNRSVALALDNITYTPAGAMPEEVMLMGYNIYRDGVRLNAEPEGEAAFNDNDVENGKSYTYKVTTVYDKGESVYSNEATVTYVSTSIDGTAGGRIMIAAGEGAITVIGANGTPVRVFTAAGVRLYDAVACGPIRIPAASGVYVVSAGNKKVKVSVR